MKHCEPPDSRIGDDPRPPDINHQLLIGVVTHHGGVVVNVQPLFLVLSNSLSNYVDYFAAPMIEIEGLVFVSLPPLRSHPLGRFWVCEPGHHIISVQYSEMVFPLQLFHV